MKDLPARMMLFIFFSLLFFTAGAGAQAAPEKMWRLEQTSEFYGSQTIMWNDRFFRLELESVHLVAVAKAPSWEVSVYNTQSRRYCCVSFEEFRRRYVMHTNIDVTRQFIPGKARPRKIGDQIASQYDLIVSHSGASRFNGPEVNEIWTCALPMPQQVKESLAALTHIPSTVGTPVTIYGDKLDHRRRVLETISIGQLSLNRKLLDVPAGMQKMNNELALLLDQDDDQGAVFSDISYLAGKSHEKR